MIQITDKDFEAPAAQPMKPQRRVSTQSERWASDQRLVIEFLKRQSELATWIETVLETKLSSHDLHESLRSGLVLCQLMNRIRAASGENPLPTHTEYSDTMGPWRERENISLFLQACRRLGVSECSLFCSEDLYEGSNMIQVIFGLYSLADFVAKSEREIPPLKRFAADEFKFSPDLYEKTLEHLQKAGQHMEYLLHATELEPDCEPSSIDSARERIRVRQSEFKQKTSVCLICEKRLTLEEMFDHSVNCANSLATPDMGWNSLFQFESCAIM